MLSRTVRKGRSAVLPASRVVNRLYVKGYSSGPVQSRSRFIYPEGMVPYEEDYVEQAEYPKTDPETHDWNEHKKQRRQKVLDFHKRIQERPNVEAKTLEWNLGRCDEI